MKKTAVAVLAALVAFSVSAQDIAGLRIMVAFSASGLRDAGILRDSLEAALAGSPSAAAVFRQESGESDLNVSATKHSCQISLSVAAVGGEEGVRIEWSYLSPVSGGGVLRSGSFVKNQPNVRDLVSAFWTELVQDLVPAIQAMGALPLDHIIVAAPPGARVEGFGDPLVVPAEGEVEVPLGIPAFVRWKASSVTHLDANGTAFVEAPLVRVELPMRRLPAWTAELSLYGFSFPEARFSFLIGKRLFARVALTQFLAGLNLQKYDGPPPALSLSSSYSLLHSGVGFGTYFSGPERNLRFYAALDAFLRLDMPGFRTFFIDPIAPLGLAPIFGAEWGRAPSAKLFFELGGILYPYAIVDLMLASRGSSTGNLVFSGSGWFPGHPGWLGEFPLPRLGLKVYL
jgi:hypothetical protein